MKRLEGKAILVTGATGFIGSHLVARLSEISGVHLLLLSRQPRHSEQPNAVWIKSALGQLTPGFWRDHSISHIDYVFHLGGYVPKSSADANNAVKAIEDNILGTNALLESLPRSLGTFVFTSTLDVYAQKEDSDVITEHSKVSPKTLYGASKFFCESIVSAWARCHNCHYVILRYGHIYGPGEEKYEKLIPAIIRNLSQDIEPLIYGDGSVLRDYFYVDDAVEATLRSALVRENIDPLNVVSGQALSINEIAQLLISLTGSKQRIKYRPDKQNYCSILFDNTKMKELLGIWPVVPLETGLASEIKAFRKK